MNHIQMAFMAVAYPAALEVAVEAASCLPVPNPMEAAWAAASFSGPRERSGSSSPPAWPLPPSWRRRWRFWA